MFKTLRIVLYRT